MSLDAIPAHDGLGPTIGAQVVEGEMFGMGGKDS